MASSRCSREGLAVCCTSSLPRASAAASATGVLVCSPSLHAGSSARLAELPVAVYMPGSDAVWPRAPWHVMLPYCLQASSIPHLATWSCSRLSTGLLMSSACWLSSASSSPASRPSTCLGPLLHSSGSSHS